MKACDIVVMDGNARYCEVHRVAWRAGDHPEIDPYKYNARCPAGGFEVKLEDVRDRLGKAARGIRIIHEESMDPPVVEKARQLLIDIGWTP